MSCAVEIRHQVCRDRETRRGRRTRRSRHIVVIRREIKKRQDSVEQYEKANRQDLADTEKAEIAVLEKYLPAAMSAGGTVEVVEPPSLKPARPRRRTWARS